MAWSHPFLQKNQGILTKKKFTFLSRSPVKEPPPCSTKGAPMESDAPSPESVVYSIIHSYLSESPVKELSHRMRKHTVTVHTAPRGRKAYIQWSAAWFPSGIVYDTVITTPFSTVPSTLAPLVSVCRNNPPQNVSSAPVTTSHVIQGKDPRNPEVRIRGWIYGRIDFLRSLISKLKKPYCN
jgi:hypothetical protein